jgi:hypothetical protein
MARGVPAAQAESAVRPTAPSDVRFDVRRDDGFIVVNARRINRSPLPGLQVPLQAQASCVDEQ